MTRRLLDVRCGSLFGAMKRTRISWTSCETTRYKKLSHESAGYPMRRWYYKSGQRIFGPVTASKILELRLDESLSLKTVVWKADGDPVSLGDVLEEVARESWTEDELTDGKRKSERLRGDESTVKFTIQCPYCDAEITVPKVGRESEVKCHNCRGRSVIAHNPSNRLLVIAIASSDPVAPEDQPAVEIVGGNKKSASSSNYFAALLGLPDHLITPDHYELLELARFTDDEQAIKNAAIRQYGKLQRWQNSDTYSTHVRPIELKLAEARMTLLDPDKKRDYDARLRQS